MTHRSENEDLDIFYSRVTLDGTCSLFTIHARHLHIQQDDVVWISCPLSIAQTLQSFGATGNGLDPATHCFHILGQDQPIGLVIINDQNSGSAHVYRSGERKRRCTATFLRRLFFEFHVEPESASHAGCAVNADLSTHCFNQLFTDREAKACSTVFAGGGSVCLCEAIEDRGLPLL